MRPSAPLFLRPHHRDNGNRADVTSLETVMRMVERGADGEALRLFGTLAPGPRLGSAPLLVSGGLAESLAGRFEIMHLPRWRRYLLDARG